MPSRSRAYPTPTAEIHIQRLFVNDLGEASGGEILTLRAELHEKSLERDWLLIRARDPDAGRALETVSRDWLWLRFPDLSELAERVYVTGELRVDQWQGCQTFAMELRRTDKETRETAAE